MLLTDGDRSSVRTPAPPLTVQSWLGPDGALDPEQPRLHISATTTDKTNQRAPRFCIIIFHLVGAGLNFLAAGAGANSNKACWRAAVLRCRTLFPYCRTPKSNKR